MDIVLKALGALWKVVAVGLLLGAGLPALFSLGIRSLNTGRVLVTDGTQIESRASRPRASRCGGLLRPLRPGRHLRHRRDRLRQAALQLI